MRVLRRSVRPNLPLPLTLLHIPVSFNVSVHCTSPSLNCYFLLSTHLCPSLSTAPPSPLPLPFHCPSLSAAPPPPTTQCREKHSRQRLSLESSLSSLKGEMQQSQLRLQQEELWRDSLEKSCKRLQQEKTQLQAK